MAQLRDLDELLLQCRSPTTRSYALEAVSAYQAGAYRASIVTVWTAVLFDIIEKIRELAIFGNEEAKKMIQDFDRWHAEIAKGNAAVLTQALGFERSLLITARDKFELIDGQQFRDLERLQEDRNRCAHPTFATEGLPYEPSAEQARVHLCNATTHVFQQPPVQGRAARSLLKTLITSEFFPQSVSAARTALSESLFARPSKALVVGLVDDILFGFFEHKNPFNGSSRALSALMGILGLQRGIAEARVDQQANKIVGTLDDRQLSLAVHISGNVPAFARALNESNRTKLRTFLLLADFDIVAPALQGAFGCEHLSEAAAQRVQSLTYAEVEAVIARGLGTAAVDRAVELYCQSRDWGAANARHDKLIAPVFNHLTSAHVERIIRASKAEGADLYGSHGFRQLTGRLLKSGPMARLDVAELLREQDYGWIVEEAEENEEVLERMRVAKEED